MLYPKQTKCSENGNINSLISSIDCRLSRLANTLFNNTVFMLNKTISGTEMFDLIQYKRILFYKQINPDYVSNYSVNQIASQVKRFTANCSGGCNDDNIFPAPPIRTTTTTTSISTTTTTSSTTTTTTTLKVIDCGVSSEFSGVDFYPTTEFVILGNVIGTVVLSYNTENIPDRFIVQWNGNDVIDTGYRGPNSYDFGGAVRTFFNSTLEGKVDPITFVTYPNFTNYPDDGYPRVLAPGIGTASFYKNSTNSASATVKIYSPTDSRVYDPGDRVWLYTLACPVTTTTSTSTSTTTTTTTLAPEQLRMVATGVNTIIGFGANPGIIINSSSAFKINWGDGPAEEFTAGTNINISHTYSTPYTGDIIIEAVDLSNITSLIVQSTPHPLQSLSVTTTELGNLEGLLNFKAELVNGLFVTGDVNLLPKTLTELIIANTNVSGTTGNLPEDLTRLEIRGSNTITGDTLNLPINLTRLDIQGSNTISGNTSNLPNTTLSCIVGGQNTITGDTADLPKPTINLIIEGQNTISGNISDLSRASTVVILGRNTITGNVSGFGGILNTTTLSLKIGGLLPSFGNTITGSISDFPPNLEILEIQGKSSISGNLSDLPTNLQTVVLISGGVSPNTFSGDVLDLPATLDFVQLSSTGLFEGDLVNLPAGIKQFNLGMEVDLTYNLITPRTWAAGVFAISLPPASGTVWNGFTRAETDKLLIEVAPQYINNSSTTNRCTLLCAETPPYTTTDPDVIDAIDLIETALGFPITFYISTP
jgi:hypothetical protein